MTRRLATLSAFLALLVACTPNIGLGLESPTPPVVLGMAREAGVTDLRGRFREIFCALSADHGAELPDHRLCGEALHRLDGEPAASGRPVALEAPAARRRIVIVPGIFGECVRTIALPFQGEDERLRRQGYRIDTIPVSGRSSSAENARTITAWLRANMGHGERLLLIGYSKGVSDILEALGSDPGAIPPGSAIVSISGVVAGTPIADRWEAAHDAVDWMPIPYCRPGDRGGVSSLTRRHRLAWLAANPLPRDRSYYSLAAFAARRDVSRLLRPFHRQLATIDERNDGQMLFHDAVIPGSYLLGYPNADHWAVTLPLARNSPWLAAPFANRNAYPRAILLEAIVRTVEEQDQAR